MVHQELGGVLMLSHQILKKFQRKKSLIISILQIHIALLLFIGIILLMGNLKNGGETPLHLLFPLPTPDTKTSEQPLERKTQVLLPPEESAVTTH